MSKKKNVTTDEMLSAPDAWEGKCHDCRKPLNLKIVETAPNKKHKCPVLYQFPNGRLYGKCPGCFAKRPRLAKQPEDCKVMAAALPG